MTMAQARTWPARVLAFAKSVEPRARPAGSARVVDATLAAGAALASLAIAARYPGPRAVPVTVELSCLLTTVPLAVRRIFPLTAFVIVLGAVLTINYFNFVSFIAVVVTAYSAAVHSRFRGAALMTVPLAGVLVTLAFPDSTPPLPGRFAALLILIPVVIVGNATHQWRRRAHDSHARLQTIEAEHEAATMRALAAERTRIAAELHDVVTHNVSVMVVQAGAARRVMTVAPADATDALLAVEASGRAAMIELQHLLGLLSPVDGLSLADAGLLKPQPGLDQLAPLVDRIAAAGPRVDLTVIGQQSPLPSGVNLTAYRVVQEGLTNVIKHAGQTRAAVTVDYRPLELVIEVLDDGPPAGPQSGESGPAPAGGGRGLLGLRERVSLYGGRFDAGPRPGGGWRVTVRLPRNCETGDGGAGAESFVPAPPAQG